MAKLIRDFTPPYKRKKGFPAAHSPVVKYWSRPGNGFIALDPQKDNYTRAITGELIADENALDCMVAVNLPNECTVTAAVIYGNLGLSDKTWELHGAKITDLAQIALASAAGNTEDTSITNAVIDNTLYAYCLHITDLDNTDEIYGARITYTTIK